MFPSLTHKRLLALLGGVDRRLGGKLKSLAHSIEKRYFTKFNQLHRVGLFLPEEDDHILIHILSSALLGLYFPYVEFEDFAQFDVAVAPSDRRRIMIFYQQCLKRQAAHVGQGKTFISKNPFFTGKIESLLQQFPDCRFICMVRNPFDVLPSNISVARNMIRLAFGIEPGPELDDEIYGLIKFNYLHSIERLADLPADRCLILKYEDLLRRPKETFLHVYKTFGLALTTESEACLDEEVKKMSRYESHHVYSLNDISISRERIRSDLAPIFERFGFGTGEGNEPAGVSSSHPENNICVRADDSGGSKA